MLKLNVDWKLVRALRKMHAALVDVLVFCLDQAKFSRVLFYSVGGFAERLCQIRNRERAEMLAQLLVLVW